MIQVQMNDWRGNPIEPGALIVYPGRQGSNQWMVEAEVLEIFQDWHWHTFVWALRVQPIRQGTYGRTNMKPVKITALERVTVVGHVRDLEKNNANSL
jgi:hypothetical protein